MKAKTVMYTTWITAVTAILAALSFVMLALSMHHATRSAAGHDGGNVSFGFHDGGI